MRTFRFFLSLLFFITGLLIIFKYWSFFIESRTLFGPLGWMPLGFPLALCLVAVIGMVESIRPGSIFEKVKEDSEDENTNNIN